MGASASVDQVQIICSNVERAVPRTPGGSRDVEHCDRDGLTDVISRAEQDIKAFYDAAWESCVADDLLAATAAFQADFPGAKPPPRCALPEGATVDELEELASERAEAMHAALEQPVKESGGAYFQGPRKGTLRIKEKAEADYGGDVARVVDVERATGVYGTADEFNAAISKLRAAARGEELRILRCNRGRHLRVAGLRRGRRRVPRRPVGAVERRRGGPGLGRRRADDAQQFGGRRRGGAVGLPGARDGRRGLRRVLLAHGARFCRG